MDAATVGRQSACRPAFLEPTSTGAALEASSIQAGTAIGFTAPERWPPPCRGSFLSIENPLTKQQRNDELEQRAGRDGVADPAQLCQETERPPLRERELPRPRVHRGSR